MTCRSPFSSLLEQMISSMTARVPVKPQSTITSQTELLASKRDSRVSSLEKQRTIGVAWKEKGEDYKHQEATERNTFMGKQSIDTQSALLRRRRADVVRMHNKMLDTYAEEEKHSRAILADRILHCTVEKRQATDAALAKFRAKELEGRMPQRPATMSPTMRNHSRGSGGGRRGRQGDGCIFDDSI